MRENDNSLKLILGKLNSNDLHFVYIRMLLTNSFGLVRGIHTDDDKIKQILQCTEYRGTTFIEDFVRQILMSRESAVIPEYHTEWIDPKNKRLCIFVWLYLLTKEPPEELSVVDRWGRRLSNYEIYLMPINPTSSATCLKLFHDFFYVFERDLSSKINFLNEIRQEWERVTKFEHRMLKALEVDNEEVTKWFWNYSMRFIGRPMIPLDFDTFKDKLALVQAMCDGLKAYDSDKVVMLNKTYSAFHSKKFKEKPKDQKGANFWFSPDQLSMLTEIAAKKKLSEKDALRLLLLDAYAKLSK